MSFNKWIKTQLPEYRVTDDSTLVRRLKMAYAAGERQGRIDTEEIAKKAIKLRELLRSNVEVSRK